MEKNKAASTLIFQSLICWSLRPGRQFIHLESSFLTFIITWPMVALRVLR